MPKASASRERAASQKPSKNGKEDPPGLGNQMILSGGNASLLVSGLFSIRSGRYTNPRLRRLHARRLERRKDATVQMWSRGGYGGRSWERRRELSSARSERHRANMCSLRIVLTLKPWQRRRVREWGRRERGRDGLGRWWTRGRRSRGRGRRWRTEGRGSAPA